MYSKYCIIILSNSIGNKRAIDEKEKIWEPKTIASGEEEWIFSIFLENHIDKVKEEVEKNSDKSVIILSHDAVVSEVREQLSIQPNVVLIKEFQHRYGNEVYEAILNKEIREIRKWLVEEIRIRILSPLLPLHLSLQSLYGISKDEDGNWVYFGRDNYYKVKKEKAGIKKANKDDIDLQFKKGFPNPEAFLLVEDAKWDFYAPIFDKIIPECENNKADGDYNECTGEKEEYEGKKIAELLGEFIKSVEKQSRTPQERIKTLKELQNEFENNYEQSEGNYINIKDSSKVFINCLREICAILANTHSYEDSRCRRKIEVQCEKGEEEIINATFAYKGKCAKERNRILKKLNISNPHCKLPDQNNKATDNYRELINQLKKWGEHNGWRKAKVVIQGIEELANCLEKSISRG